MRWPISTAMVVLALLSAAACAGTPEDESPPTDLAQGASPFASYDGDGTPGDGPQALLEGVIDLRDGCVVVAPPGLSSAQTSVIPVLPAGTRWFPREHALDVDGQTITLGETVAFVGGEAGRLERFTIPDECPIGLPYFLVTSVEEAGG